jgi:hypothetical protein
MTIRTLALVDGRGIGGNEDVELAQPANSLHSGRWWMRRTPGKELGTEGLATKAVIGFLCRH